MCKFYKFYICAVFGIIIDLLDDMHGVTTNIFGLPSAHSRNQKSSMLVPITVALLFKALINHLHSPFMPFIILKGMFSRFGK